MAYRHYETLGLVLGSQPRNEANRLYQIYTADFGLIKVLAQGVRLEKSKLRYNLQDFGLSHLTLVRGKEFWRLTGAEKEGDLNPQRVVFFRKISSILLRLIQGESAHSAIFKDLEKAWQLLSETEISKDDLLNLEIFIIIRLLFELGYLAKSDLTQSVFWAEDFSWTEIRSLQVEKNNLIRLINLTLSETGL